MENLAEDEVPPEWMWPFEDELKVWFEEVDEKRKDKYGIQTDSEPDNPKMMKNAYAVGRGGG